MLPIFNPYKSIVVTAAIMLVQVLTAQNNAPDKIYGQLFIDVQLQRIFPDGKTFVDCIPKRKVADIMYDYGMQKGTGFNLKKFVEDNFVIPTSVTAVTPKNNGKNIVSHINNLWPILTRQPDVYVQGSSLLPLPYPYIVPGGRFREMYYWDSYFTMLGLKESNKIAELENMVKNFAHLLNTYGHIPNGTRTYYLGRSQPPFFSMMIDLLASVKNNEVYKTYLPQLLVEYNYFMQGADSIANGMAHRYVVKTTEGAVLNRYWDDMDVPRQESYAEDVATANKACSLLAMRTKFVSQASKDQVLNSLQKKIYRNLRAAACSGLDFSNKWFADGVNIETIHTTDFIAVDLNALLLHLEQVIAHTYTLLNDKQQAAYFENKLKQREAALIKYCWNTKLNYFTDYDFVMQQPSNAITPMGMFPFCFLNPSNKVYLNYASKATTVLQKNLLKAGGLQSTIKGAKQQWDAPNGWAPMQWMSIVALERFKQNALSKQIALRWLAVNKKVFINTGKMMEKYNVVNTNLIGGGGEYPGQDGFGWTNGVFLALQKKYQ
ncbi:MAG: alpha,alpha-trehalase TreF [Chitinophagaceae bacterium]